MVVLQPGSALRLHRRGEARELEGIPSKCKQCQHSAIGFFNRLRLDADCSTVKPFRMRINRCLVRHLAHDESHFEGEGKIDTPWLGVWQSLQATSCTSLYAGGRDIRM